MNICTPPQEIPAFEDYVAPPLRASAMMAIAASATVTAVEACKADLVAPRSTDCQSFTNWTQWTAAFCGALGTAASAVGHVVHDEQTRRPIIAVIKALYASVAGVNEQFLAAIVQINAGHDYAPLPGPSSVPAFPDDADAPGAIVENAWHLIEPFLQAAIARLPTGSPWIKVIEGLISSSSASIDAIKQMFAKAQ